MANIKTIRARIVALKHEAAELERIRFSRDELRARIDAYAKSLAADAEPWIRSHIGGAAFGGPLGGVFHVPAAPGGGIDAGKLLAAVLGPKAIADALCARLDAAPTSADAEARALRLVEIGRELDTLERDEERLVEASELTDDPIARRPDARPEIVLALGSV